MAKFPVLFKKFQFRGCQREAPRPDAEARESVDGESLMGDKVKGTFSTAASVTRA